MREQLVLAHSVPLTSMAYSRSHRQRLRQRLTSVAYALLRLPARCWRAGVLRRLSTASRRRARLRIPPMPKLCASPRVLRLQWPGSLRHAPADRAPSAGRHSRSATCTTATGPSRSLSSPGWSESITRHRRRGIRPSGTGTPVPPEGCPDGAAALATATSFSIRRALIRTSPIRLSAG